MNLFGLIGYPLTHTASPAFFQKLFREKGITDADYQAFPMEDIAEFPDLLRKKQACGLNVTVPYKKKILDFVNEMSEEVRICGAANTLLIDYSGKNPFISAFNTDVHGFTVLASPLLNEDCRALILGSGGSAAAVALALERLGVPYSMVSSSGKKNCISYNQLDEKILDQHRLIVQCTPVGMFPYSDKVLAFPFHCIGSGHTVIDLIYNPSETVFMQKASEMGALTVNGQLMLHAQAEKSWEIWSNQKEY